MDDGLQQQVTTTTLIKVEAVISEIFLCFSGADKLIKIWNAEDMQLELTLAGHTLGICDITWSAADYLASASDDCTIRIWDVTTVHECSHLTTPLTSIKTLTLTATLSAG